MAVLRWIDGRNERKPNSSATTANDLNHQKKWFYYCFIEKIVVFLVVLMGFLCWKTAICWKNSFPLYTSNTNILNTKNVLDKSARRALRDRTLEKRKDLTTTLNGNKSNWILLIWFLLFPYVLCCVSARLTPQSSACLVPLDVSCCTFSSAYCVQCATTTYCSPMLTCCSPTVFLPSAQQPATRGADCQEGAAQAPGDAARQAGGHGARAGEDREAAGNALLRARESARVRFSDAARESAPEKCKRAVKHKRMDVDFGCFCCVAGDRIVDWEETSGCEVGADAETDAGERQRDDRQNLDERNRQSKQKKIAIFWNVLVVFLNNLMINFEWIF